MTISRHRDAAELGEAAAALAAERIGEAIRDRGGARVLVATGLSQFEFHRALRAKGVDWAKVRAFHLDEYIGIGPDHPASFVRYIKERFASGLPLAGMRYIDGLADVGAEIASLNAAISEREVDVAFIGIGENAHVAFNDPPADFETEEPYIVVRLDEACRRQQVGEGWFASMADVPAEAISMSPRQIMKARTIISVVPHKVKAEAVRATLAGDLDPRVPATILKGHPDWTLFIDGNSGSLL